jgi:glycosyltransferase involved in cell wall biosynthesis
LILPITFVSSHARLGGSERYLVTLLERLGPEWIRDVVVLEHGPLVEELRASDRDPVVVAASSRRVSALSAGLRLRRLLVARRPALVHANGVKAALIAVMATVGTGIPVVWLKHDVSKDGRASRLVAARCKRVVGVSSFVMEGFPAAADDPKFRVVYTGLEPHDVDQAEGKRRNLQLIGSTDEVPIVGMVGRLDPRKGHGELIGAVPRVRERHPEARFLLVGGEDPAYVGWRSELERSAANNGAIAAIEFVGHRSDATELMAGFDVAVIPSMGDETGAGREAFSLVGLEYLWCGTPVVAYNAGGLPELLGECGVLVPEGDRDALADAIADLLAAPERRAELAACGRDRVTTRFRLERMVDSLIEIYREAAA